jgi:hypothetical protein
VEETFNVTNDCAAGGNFGDVVGAAGEMVALGIAGVASTWVCVCKGLPLVGERAAPQQLNRFGK